MRVSNPPSWGYSGDFSKETGAVADAVFMGTVPRALCGASLIMALGVLSFGQDQPSPAPDSTDTPPATDSAPQQGTFHDAFRFHAYADVDYLREDNPSEPARFDIGEIVLFGTATISPRLSALSEIVVDTDGATSVSNVPVNVERLLLQYRVSDYLKLEAGQYRTAIGYYSTAYLRGAWFQTAISRPRMFAFEEDGGILPLHTTGISASGLIPSGSLGLHYVAETGNARTWGTAGATPTGHDAVNIALFARPRAVPGLEIGVSDYHDRFAPVPGLTTDRQGVMAHVVYVANRFEFLNEGIAASLCYGPANATATFSGFYSQIGYRIGPNWGPYARVEKLSVHADPLFLNLVSTVATWRNMYTAGVRYDWNEHVAIKLEGGHEADWGVPHYYQLGAQIAFAF